MRPLDRKLLRDAWHYRGQFAAIIAVVTCGVALFVALRSMNGFLRGSRDRYYAEYRFADVFAPLKRAPIRDRVPGRRARGVRAVEPRIVFDVTLDVPGLAEPAVGRLVSIPVPRAPMLNELHLFRGRWPAAGSSRRRSWPASPSARRTGWSPATRSARCSTGGGNGCASWGSRSRPSTSTRSARRASSRTTAGSACCGWDATRSPTPSTCGERSTT